MKKELLFAAAAIFAVSFGTSAIAAAPSAKDIAAAEKDYKEATAKAKASYDASIAACKKLADDKQSACNKEARMVRRKARDDAGDTYAKIVGKPEPGGD